MRSPPLTTGLLAGLAGAATVVALVSCGDGSSVSTEEFKGQASRVCRDVEQQLDRIQATDPVTADQAEMQAEAVTDVSEQALDNLRKIEPPEDLRATYDRYLDEREKAIGFIEDARDAAGDNDSDAYVQAKRRLAEGQPTRRGLALQLDLSACSRPSLPSGAGVRGEP
jgi:hypothetical protein